jgi:dUTP pyrophosphatase
LTNHIELEVRLVDDEAQLPAQAYAGDGAFDLHAHHDAEVLPGQRQIVGCGIAIAVPDGYAGLVLPRSGLAANYGVTVLNGPGLVDSGYRGEVRVVLFNSSSDVFAVSQGDRVAQLMLVALPSVSLRPVAALPASSRGEGGFGSSGR